ncbi:MAG: hypothetical protein U0163_21325, partial [Gemmatimonadaceae bacterium]
MSMLCRNLSARVSLGEGALPLFAESAELGSMNALPTLPIDDILPDLARSLAERTGLVLQAPPGAGKTTRVPLAVLDHEWLGGQRIL